MMFFLPEALDRIGIHFRHDQRHLGVRSARPRSCRSRRQPCAPIFGDHSFEIVPPADIRQISVSEKSYWSSVFTFRVWSPKETSVPWLRRDGERHHLVGRGSRARRGCSASRGPHARGSDDRDLVAHVGVSFVASLCQRGSAASCGSCAGSSPRAPGENHRAREGRSAGRRGFRGGRFRSRAGGRNPGSRKRPGDGSHGEASGSDWHEDARSSASPSESARGSDAKTARKSTGSARRQPRPRDRPDGAHAPASIGFRLPTEDSRWRSTSLKVRGPGSTATW